MEHPISICTGETAKERKNCSCFKERTTNKNECMHYRKETAMCDCLKAQTTETDVVELEELDLEMYRDT
jgi:hypothetical protein